MEVLAVVLAMAPPVDRAAAITVEAFHHILLWPLVMRGPRDRDPGSERTIKPRVEALTKAGWQETRSTTSPTGAVDDDYTYPEIVYFHPFVRDFLFGDGRPGSETRPLRRFVRNDFQALKVSFLLDAGRNKLSCDLEFRVERTELFLIRPRVLILLVEISNRKLSHEDPEPELRHPRQRLTLEHVYNVQSRLRNLSPPYFDGDRKGEVLDSVEWVRSCGDETRKPRYATTSPRSEFEAFVRAGSEPPVFDHWQVFFGNAIAPLQKAADRDDAGLFLQQMIDDRIPSMSFIGVDDPTRIHIDDIDRLPAFDAPGLDYEPGFREAQRGEFCYRRFSHWGTTYYGNGTSFALVCKAHGFSKHLLQHFRRHYTHMGLIAHFQHTALLYFADELADIAKELAAEEEPLSAVWRERIRLLQHRFLKFRTRAYFHGGEQPGPG